MFRRMLTAAFPRTPGGTIRKRVNCVRPLSQEILQLEDRVVPATITVLTNGDAPGALTPVGAELHCPDTPSRH